MELGDVVGGDVVDAAGRGGDVEVIDHHSSGEGKRRGLRRERQKEGATSRGAEWAVSAHPTMNMLVE